MQASRKNAAYDTVRSQGIARKGPVIDLKDELEAHRAGGCCRTRWEVSSTPSLLKHIRAGRGTLFVAFSPHGELRETRIEGRLVAEVVKRLFRAAGYQKARSRRSRP